jgi:hypothetical protein
MSHYLGINSFSGHPHALIVYTLFDTIGRRHLRPALAGC